MTFKQGEIWQNDKTNEKFEILEITGGTCYLRPLNQQNQNEKIWYGFSFMTTWFKIRSQITIGMFLKNKVETIFKIESMNIEKDQYQLKILKVKEGNNLQKVEGDFLIVKKYRLDECIDATYIETIKSRDSKNQYFLKIAQLVSTRATCPRRSVGCVIVNKFDHIKSTGYNGVPRNYPHCIDKPCGGESSASGQGLNSCMATHAEQNALLQCDNVMEIEKIYITTSPCITCAKLIGNTSCKQVIYSEEYSDKSGIEMLNKLGIETIYEPIK